jgi:peptidoglycan/LPS O-acetylase OafA/YrhL
MVVATWTQTSAPPKANEAATRRALANGTTLCYLLLTVCELGAELLNRSCPSGQWVGGRCASNFYRTWNSRFGFELTTPLFFALWLHALAQSPDALAARAMRCRLFQRMGDYSFALYVLHLPLLGWFELLVMGYRAYSDCGAGPRSLPATYVLPFTIFAVLISAAAFHLIEQPVRRVATKGSVTPNVLL